jgi:chemotaxis protein MotB
MGAGRGDPITSVGTMDTDAFRDPFQPIARAAGGDFLSEYKPEAPPPRPASSEEGKDGKEKGAAIAGPAAPDQPGAPPTTKPVAAPAPSAPSSQNPPSEPGRPAPPKPGAVVQTQPPGEALRPAASDAAHEAPRPAGKSAAQQAPGKAEEAKAQSANAQANIQSPANVQNNEVGQLRSDLLKEIGSPAALEPGPGLEVQATDEGLLISLTDQFDFSMFAVGSAEPQPRVVHIMEKIAQVLKNKPGVIVVRGHTDARPYRSAVYDNWRLSSARAQMAYYMLVRGGLPEKRVERIEGYSDRRLKTPNNPMAAENRRIEILLRAPKP